MKFRYNPFDVALSDLTADSLAALREVAEGWYVEYKSELITVKALSKSLSAFANQYGGWLILGVQEAPATLTAGGFPGIPSGEVTAGLQRIREASKDLLNPEVFYETAVFDGPVDALELADSRSIIVVRIPAGPESPYVHADGRVYRRVADSSAPKPETDRSTLERLWERGERAKSRLGSFVSQLPAISRAEENNCYLHLSVLSDPYEIQGHSFGGGFPAFANVMRGYPIPFDNLYSRAGGFVGRQVASNDPSQRLLTWEFGPYCHTFITLPINTMLEPYVASLSDYRCGEDFAAILDRTGIRGLRVLDLNMVFEALSAVACRHRELVAIPGIRGPLYVKAQLQNVWRTVPFLDAPAFLSHAEENGVPVVQDENVLAPLGTDLETFVMLPERQLEPAGEGYHYQDAARMAVPIFEGLGIPADVLGDATDELFDLAERFRQAQRRRNEGEDR